MTFLREIFTSRFLHLTIGLVLFYGASQVITRTSRVEKIVDSLRWLAYTDYYARYSKSTKETLEAEFYRKKYEERLRRLTEDLFYFQDRGQLQDFLFRQGFVYEVSGDDEGLSHMLAPILESDSHVEVLSGKVDFDYLILGRKKIETWQEVRDGPWTGVFVSKGREGVYIHRDSLDQILRQYFNLLWAQEAQNPGDFSWPGWPLTYSLSRDLESVCENVFTHRYYRNKRIARDYFIEEGFDSFLPTLLAMADRMAADGETDFSSGTRYQRAYLTGLYREPTYTMFALLGDQATRHNPWTARLHQEFDRRLDLKRPDRISLGDISTAAREIFEKLEYSQ